MIKKSWPWIDFAESKSISDNSQERPATLAVGESHSPSNDPILHQDGIQSPLNYASDKDNKKSKSRSNIEVYNDKDDIIASFSCDIAKTMQEKIAGLQTYDHLGESAGLLFEYKKPEDVVYHMGTVKFPIDILFLGKDNNIKKIYKNIQPGTLATFGCAEVKNVLEICGGLCDRLGISSGNKVAFIEDDQNHISQKISKINKFSQDFGGGKNIIIKYSSIGNNSFSNWKGFPILNVNNKIVKVAKKETLLSDFVINFGRPSNKNIKIFDFDGIIEKSPNIRLFKISDDTISSQPYITIAGTTAAIIKNAATGEEVYKDFHIKDILTKKFKQNISIISSQNKSFENFMKSGSDAQELFSEMRKSIYNKKEKPVIVTRFPNSKYLKEIIATNYKNQFGEYPLVEIIQIPENWDAYNIIENFRKKYGNQEYKIYSDDTILKRAGLPISNHIKEKARSAYKKLDNAQNYSKDSITGLKKNVEEYNKLNTTNPDAVKNTKGQYNESCKNNKKLFVKILEEIKDAIKILTEIADSTTTPQIIDSLTASTKSNSESLQAILNLAESLESPEFINLLTEKTTSYENSMNDLKSSIDSGKKHINSDILGLVVLSE